MEGDTDIEIKNLKEQLEVAEQNAARAAELGKMLLEQNEELSDRLDDLRKQNDKKLEVITALTRNCRIYIP